MKVLENLEVVVWEI